MWCVARRATYIGAASCLLDVLRLTAVAEEQEPLIRSDAATATGTATDARLYSNSNPAASPSTNSDKAVPRNLGDGLKKKKPPAKGPAESPALKEGTHFAVLTSDGTSSKLAAVAAAMRQADVVLLGEYHDDAVAHALQLSLLKHVASRLGYPTAQAAQQQPPQGTGSEQQNHKQKQTHQHTAAPQTSQNPPQQQQQPAGQARRPLILSLEMFETDVQPVLSEYVAGMIPLSDLMKDGRPWSNYMHDYHHLVEVCKQLQLPVVAANAPRRYVSLAGRAGSKSLLGLPAAAKQYLPPLPHTPSSEPYVQKVQQNMQQAAADLDAFRNQQDLLQQQRKAGQGKDLQASHKQQQQQHKHQSQPQKQQQSVPAAESKSCPYIGLTVSSNFLAAQSLWDATMAYSIAQALQQHKQQQGAAPNPGSTSQPDAAAVAGTATAGATAGSNAAGGSGDQGAASVGAADAVGSSIPQGPLVVHVCGKFHCEHRLGIPEHLAAYAPEAKVLVVVFTPADSLAVSPEEAAAAGLVGAADFVVLTDSKVPRSFIVGHPV